MDTPEVAPVASEPVSAPPPAAEPVAAPETAGPRTTADIVYQVVNEAEAKAEAPEAAAPMTEEELSDAAKFIVGKGHKWGKRTDPKTGLLTNVDASFLPSTTVAKMLEGYAEQRVAAQEARLTAAEKERQRVEADLTEYINALKGDPRAFLETVAQADPRYKPFLTPQQAAQQAVAAENDPEPQPDVDLGNGRMTYSLDGLKKLREWDQRKYERAIDQRMQPWAEREKAEKDRAQQQEFQEQVRVKARSQMEEAQSWPLFGQISADGSLTPFQAEVLGILQADPKATLATAYIKVSAKQMAADDATRRAEYAKELNSAPKSTSMSRTGVDAVSTSTGKRTTHDIVREAIAKAEAG